MAARDTKIDECHPLLATKISCCALRRPTGFCEVRLAPLTGSNVKGWVRMISIPQNRSTRPSAPILIWFMAGRLPKPLLDTNGNIRRQEELPERGVNPNLTMPATASDQTAGHRATSGRPFEGCMSKDIPLCRRDLTAPPKSYRRATLRQQCRGLSGARRRLGREFRVRPYRGRTGRSATIVTDSPGGRGKPKPRVSASAYSSRATMADVVV